MASEQERILEILAEMIASRSGGIGRSAAASMRSSSKDEGYKQRTDSDRKLDASIRKAEAAAAGMDHTTKVLPKKLADVFSKSESAFARSMAKNVKKFEDVFKIEDQAKAMAAVAAKMNAMQERKFDTKDELDVHLKELAEIANKAGLTLDDMGIKSSRAWNIGTKKYKYFIDKHASSTERLIKQSEELADSMEEAEFETNKHSKGVEHSRAKFQKLAAAIKYVTKDFLKFAEQEQRFAQQTATADAGWIKGITEMGISQLEYMKLLQDTRVESLAAATAGVDFATTLNASQDSLKGLTANYEEAAKVAAMNYKNAARMGVSQNKLGDVVLQQTDIYKKNYRALGYTAEAFAKLSEELINDQGMRSTLLNLQESERAAYVMSIQRRMAEYQTMGYTIERAKELQKTFQSLNDMDPKERMKQAAKKRAMMGAMGMGAEGAELMNLEMQYKTMNATEKAAAELRMTELNQQASKVLGEKTGSGAGIGQSMVFQMLSKNTGMDAVAKTFEVESGRGIQIANSQLTKTNEISETISKILGAMSVYSAAATSALGSLGTNLLSGLGIIIKTAIATMGVMLGHKLMSKLMGGKGTGIGKMIKGGIGKARSGIASMAAGFGFGGLNMAADVAATKGTTSAVKGTKAASMAAKEAATGAGKTLSKSAMKSGIKKVPIIGALAGIGFGISRAMNGDWLGAAGEVASGVASIFPGVGTAASVGIDAALATRDVMSGDDIGRSAGLADVTTDDISTPSGDIPKTYDMQAELIRTLQELQAYIKVVNTQNDELASSSRKLGESIETQGRMSALNKARAT